MNTQVNRRGRDEYFVESDHLKLSDLKEKARGLGNQYLIKENIPAYPRPEFHVTHLKHDTDRDGLRGIKQDNGFRDPYDPHPAGSPKLLWWSLKVTPDDIQSAERRLLVQTFPDRTEEQVQNQQSFLGRFATSPAFLDSSRLGSFRFTFPLEELLTAYSQQLCSGKEPMMRVFKTVLYKAQVMYVVLVHSPDNEEQFSKYPLLTDDPDAICDYRNGHFIWRSEAMCKTHSFRLVLRQKEKQVEVEKVKNVRDEYYVWDNVAVALHVKDKQVLKFHPNELRQKLTYCEEGAAAINKFDDYDSAQALVEELWPGSGVLVEEAEASGAQAL